MKKKVLITFIAFAMIINLGLLLPAFSPPAFSAKVIKLKFANYFPPPAKQSKICEEFIADVEKLTNGRVKIQYFAGGSLP